MPRPRTLHGANPLRGRGSSMVAASATAQVRWSGEGRMDTAWPTGTDRLHAGASGQASWTRKSFFLDPRLFRRVPSKKFFTAQDPRNIFSAASGGIPAPGNRADRVSCPRKIFPGKAPPGLAAKESAGASAPRAPANADVCRIRLPHTCADSGAPASGRCGANTLMAFLSAHV